MSNLKELKTRINSVQSTKRITSAMKMVASSKLKRAQSHAEQTRPYSKRMARMLSDLHTGEIATNAPKLLTGNGQNKRYLLVLITSDKGLCGGFNTLVTRNVKQQIRALEKKGKSVTLIIVGRKGKSILTSEYRKYIEESFPELSNPKPSFVGANKVCHAIIKRFDAGEFDCCRLIYTHFQTVLTQRIVVQSLIPFKHIEHDSAKVSQAQKAETKATAPYIYEPNKLAILEDLLPRNLAIQVYSGMLESFASEQGARMTAMDNATRNAGDMIDRLNIIYNRSRQAQITNELIEIISGAEAL